MKKKQKSLSRRSFLKRAAGVTAAVIAAPSIIPSSALGRSGFVPPSDRIVLGCIGTGNQGRGNMNQFLEKSNAQVVAVCDVDKSRMQLAKNIVDQKYGNKDCVMIEDYRQMLLRDDIDAISTATPDQWHAIIAVDCARAGKDIFGEKPLAYNVPEGRAIVDAVHRYGIVWQTGSWQRSVRNFRHACELVRNGRIGKVHTVNVGLPFDYDEPTPPFGPEKVPDELNYDMWLGPAPWRPYNHNRVHWNFRWCRDYGNGQLSDWAGHHVDIAHWGMNTTNKGPKKISGRAVYPVPGNGIFDTPKFFRFECEYDDFTMVVADRTQVPKGMGTQWIGEDGWIHVSRNAFASNPANLITSRIAPEEEHLYRSDDHFSNFLECVKTREKAVAPVDDAHYSIAVAHLGGIAMRLGRTLEWDYKTEQFVNDAEANGMLARAMRTPYHL